MLNASNIAARRRKAWFATGVGFICLVIYLSLTPSPIIIDSVDGIKTGHFIAYSWLMLWFAQIYPSWRARAAWGLGFVLMGVALEYAQAMTGYRHFAYTDMRDNAFGVTAGFLVAWTRIGGLFDRFNRA
jgi:hypothetical protein